MLSAPAIVRSLWRSPALRAASALGFSGVALACGNLMLARVLPTPEFARFSLFYAIAQIGINVGPFGADVIMTRHRFRPDAALHRQVLKHATIVAIVLALLSIAVYQLSGDLSAILVTAIIAGSVKVVPTSYYRSQQRFGMALLLTMSTNASILVAAVAAIIVHTGTARLPAGAMALSLCLTAILGWRAVATAPSTAIDAPAVYPTADAFSAVSFIAAGMILSSLDRLLTPKLLGLPALATLTVLTTIAGSPFHMLHLGIGYTLVPAMRNATNRAARVKVILHEGLVVAGACLAASAAIWALTPFLLHIVLASRYDIGWQLLTAAICLGLVKVLGSLSAAVVNALGSSGALARLGIAGWISIAAALAGGWIGSRYGLIGMVYGVATGWLMRALIVSHMAWRIFLSMDESPAPPQVVRGSGSAWE